MKNKTSKIEILAINGQVLQFTKTELFKFMMDFNFLGFALLTTLVIFIGGIQSSNPDLSLFLQILLVLSSGITYMFVYFSIMLGALFFANRISLPRIPSPLLCFPSVAVAVLVVYPLFEFVSGVGITIHGSMTREVFYYYSLVQVFDAICMVFVTPVILDKIKNSSLQVPIENEADYLTSGNTRIDKRHILYMSADEHHVSIITKNGAKQVRARIADLISQTSNDEGFQIHRSFWVSHIGVKSSRQREGKLQIEMHDGRFLPVSRGRKKAALAWLSQVD